MRRDSFAGWDRKIIPVLLGFVVFRFFVIAKDMPVGKPDSKSLGCKAIYD
jgi:phosphatidylglycerophosphatase A